MTIPERIRATYARELAAARDLLSFADDLLEGDWQGRMREKRSDPILWMEVARATKSYRAIILLASEGYGEQAAMVNRSLFEGMAAAHWARAHPDEAHENMRDHQRLSQLLWRERLIRLGWAAEAQVRDVPPADETEWASLQSKFGTYGTRLWTRHRNLDDLVRAIEDQWIEGFERNQLWNYVRVVHQLNNELLHMTGLGLGATVRSTGNGQKTMHLDSGRSDRYVPQAMVAGHWSYAQLLGLVIDEFGIPRLDDLNRVYDAGQAAFVRLRDEVMQGTGRNDPCPCGSGKKFKRCHGA